MSDKKEYRNQLRKYDISLKEIPRFHYLDPHIDDYIAANKPAVLTHSNLVQPAVEKWDLEYLEQNLGDARHTVFMSRNHKFKYFDEKKIKSRTNPKGVDFTPPTKRVEMKIYEFMKKIKEWKRGEERLYLQESLTPNVGPSIVEDFRQFNWNFITSKKTKHNWGSLTSNLLFISMEGNVTPCHYDEQQNFFAQVKGCKRCILFSPDQFENLYPHPVYHPHDRQSMVDFDRPDYAKYPKFKNVTGVECVLEPGDVLYIPIYWWHHVESLSKGGPTVTINFWYKGSPATVEYPLKDHQKVAIMRNVEKMLTEVLQDPKEVDSMLRSIVLGRYTTE